MNKLSFFNLKTRIEIPKQVDRKFTISTGIRNKKQQK